MRTCQSVAQIKLCVVAPPRGRISFLSNPEILQPPVLLFSCIVTDVNELMNQVAHSVATLCPLAVERPSPVSVLLTSSPRFTCLLHVTSERVWQDAADLTR